MPGWNTPTENATGVCSVLDFPLHPNDYQSF